MKRTIVLLRGINVGGRNRLSMADLRDALVTVGCTDVETYMQSGNAVVSAGRRRGALAGALRNALGRSHGFEPAVLVIPADELDGIMAANPFARETAQPTTVHVFFLEGPPAADAPVRLAALCAADESFELRGQALYLHAPAGIGRSRLVKNLDRALGTAVTGRNWRTIEALADLAGRVEPTPAR